MNNFLTRKDIRLFQEGKHYRIYEKLGAHLIKSGGQSGVHFAVWAPYAAYVAVMGEWNGWSKEAHPMTRFAESGVWTCFIPDVRNGQSYKYFVRSQYNNFEVDKADPFAFCTEL